MNWDQLLSTKRLGQEYLSKATSDSRTQFQRDYDRLIFSSPFRRLQNKTQVFPLPRSVFVHNRLTHSLEVASVGRSLGNMISTRLKELGENSILIDEIGSVVAAACLAHDMGNPPFGHSGEDAIKEYFLNGNGASIKEKLNNEEWSDLIFFDGNANALRLLCHQFNGRRAGGFALTYTMLASIVKYPYESSAIVNKAKFGFFQSEKESYKQIANELGIKCYETTPLKYARHPLVFLVEAADDICYQMMDVEDAHKLKIISFEKAKSLYLSFYDSEKDAKQLKKINETFNEVTDKNEQLAYLRAGVIGKLTVECVDAFFENYKLIMNGEFNSSLIKNIKPDTQHAMKDVIEISIGKIYSDPSVLQIELSGYKIISTLLDAFVDSVVKESKYGNKLMKLFPDQFRHTTNSTYAKVQSVIDYVSGMTDIYALELYRNITGMNLPSL